MRGEPPQITAVVASAALPAALAVALVPGRPVAVVIALAALGLAALVVGAAPDSMRLVARRHSMIVVFVLAALILAWFVAGVVLAHEQWHTAFRQLTNPLFGHDFNESGWPLRVGRAPVIWL